MGTYKAFVVALKFVGAFGIAIGVAFADCEIALGPMELTARNSIEYLTPLVRPLIVAGLPVIAGLKANQLQPSSRLYWLLLIGAPTGSAAAVKSTATWSSPPSAVI